MTEILTNISTEELKKKQELARQGLEKLTREEKKALRDLKILTAISLGMDRNKEIAKLLDTDKSFASKKVKQLEDRGLVYKEGEGKEVRYKVNQPSVLKFLTSKVHIKYSKTIPISDSNQIKEVKDE